MLNNPLRWATTSGPYANYQPNATYWPRLWIWIDYNDVTVPTSVSQAHQANAICVDFNQRSRFKLFLRPKFQKMLYETTLATGYSPSKLGEWIDINDPNVFHYGLKWAWDWPPPDYTGNINVSGPTPIWIDTIYWLMFKRVV